jgi:hypothetical protein
MLADQHAKRGNKIIEAFIPTRTDLQEGLLPLSRSVRAQVEVALVLALDVVGVRDLLFRSWRKIKLQKFGDNFKIIEMRVASSFLPTSLSYS